MLCPQLGKDMCSCAQLAPENEPARLQQHDTLAASLGQAYTVYASLAKYGEQRGAECGKASLEGCYEGVP